MKMKFNYHSLCKLNAFLVLLFCFLSVNSCKKQFDIADSDKIDNIREWYNKSATNNISLQFKNSNGEVFPTAIVPKWNKIVNLEVEGGNDTYQVPIEIQLPDALKQVNFALNISKDGESYKSKVVPLNIDGDFIANIPVDASKANPNTNKTMGGIGQDPIGPAPSCIDWYLVTTYYDASGNVVRVVENYVYTTCGDGGGGGSSSASTSQDIKPDTSVLNNPKIKCLLDKLLGLDGTAGNPQMLSLLNAFVGKGFDVTFRIGTTQDPNSKGETGADPNNYNKYNIVINRGKINEESQMSWVKTLLHEAFHANLMQKSYELFGHPEIALWLKKPEEMTLQELMDKMENVIQTKPQLAALHHNFIAENISIIAEGLRNFSLANNSANIHDTFTNYHFYGLAYEGLNQTSYYVNNVIKNPDGTTRIVDFFGTPTPINTIYVNLGLILQRDSSIPCI